MSLIIYQSICYGFIRGKDNRSFFLATLFWMFRGFGAVRVRRMDLVLVFAEGKMKFEQVSGLDLACDKNGWVNVEEGGNLTWGHVSRDRRSL